MELLGKSIEELQEYFTTLGEPKFRASQVYRWLYAERVFDFARMTDLPDELRKKLSAETTITLPTVKQRFVSTDGSVRYLFGLGESAKAAVEAVFMPSDGRQTICISTQAGCAVDCQFCMTAQLGLIRNLTAGEIVAQVLLALEDASPKAAAGTGALQTNIVLMGQ